MYGMLNTIILIKSLKLRSLWKNRFFFCNVKIIIANLFPHCVPRTIKTDRSQILNNWQIVTSPDEEGTNTFMPNEIFYNQKIFSACIGQSDCNTSNGYYYDCWTILVIIDVAIVVLVALVGSSSLWQTFVVRLKYDVLSPAIRKYRYS